MTLEEAKEIVSEMYAENADKSAECACKYNDFETANYFDDRCKAIDTVLKALENDKNAFIKQFEITQEANTLYEKEKEKNIKLEKEIRENYVSREAIIELAKKYDWALDGYDCDEADYKQSQAIGAWNALMIALGR